VVVFNVQIALFTSLSCNATLDEADTAVARGPASVAESTHTTQIQRGQWREGSVKDTSVRTPSESPMTNGLSREVVRRDVK
jgi:hypothetical protein